MFGDDEKDYSLLISMDNKVYLCFGIDVGVRVIKIGVIYDVIDFEEEKKFL